MHAKPGSTSIYHNVFKKVMLKRIPLINKDFQLLGKRCGLTTASTGSTAHLTSLQKVIIRGRFQVFVVPERIVRFL